MDADDDLELCRRSRPRTRPAPRSAITTAATAAIGSHDRRATPAPVGAHAVGASAAREPGQHVLGRGRVLRGERERRPQIVFSRVARHHASFANAAGASSTRSDFSARNA